MSDHTRVHVTGGVSAFVHWNGKLLLEVQKAHKWTTSDGQTRIGCGFIGGAVEKGEAVTEALQREADEEIGCGLAIQPVKGTVRVCGDGSVITTKIEDGAAFEWEARAAGYDIDSQVAVFSAIPIGNPIPLDLPALLSVDLPLFLRIGDTGLTVDAARNQGAILIERIPIPSNTLLALVNTAAVFHHLSTRHPETFTKISALAKVIS